MAIYAASVVSFPPPANPIPILLIGASNATGQGIKAGSGLTLPDRTVPYTRFHRTVSMSPPLLAGVLDFVGTTDGSAPTIIQVLKAGGRNPWLVLCGKNSSASTAWVDGGSEWATCRDYAIPTLKRAPPGTASANMYHCIIDIGGADNQATIESSLPLIFAQIRALLGKTRFYVRLLHSLTAIAGAPASVVAIRLGMTNVVAADVGNGGSQTIDNDATLLSSDNLHFDIAADTAARYAAVGNRDVTAILGNIP